jgi:hypothetical protein
MTVMTTTLPETLLDMGPWGVCIFATPQAATAMAAELGWDTGELDRLHLNPSGDAYLFHETQGGRTHTQVIRVKPGTADGEFIASDD